jgi:integrase/recombinase XerC
MQISEALERFVVQLRADGRSDHTIGQYRRAIGTLERWLAQERIGRDLASVSPEVLARFLVSPDVRLSARGDAKKTISVNATRTSLRVFFGWVHEAGYTTSNPARLVRRAICSPPPPKALSDAEVERVLGILAAARGPISRRDHLLVHLLVATGIRIGSALAIDVDDVDLDRGELRLRTVKGDREERVFLGSAIRTHLAGYLAGAPESGPLFRGPRGERLSKRQAQKRVTVWLEWTGVENSVHGLRHAFACRLLRKTGDLFLVSRALRHRSIASTAVYLSIEDEQLREAVG